MAPRAESRFPASPQYERIIVTTLDSPAVDSSAAGGGFALTLSHLYFVRAGAIVSGAVQLIVGLGRHKRRMGGQWPMMLSGGISVLAGAQFIVGGSASDPQLTSVGGYAILGGIFFLISALRLGRANQAD
ncbi:DUF308 domain-containing protein [Streptomyces sp. NPDC087226]|uniref:DUF308 domain-containing protein n=1 Tax=Streptomyces sp. NPDC087226 TaxID=3365771 RepID=UPI003812516A